MDTMSAYARSLAAGEDDRRVFDWDKAAQLIIESGTDNAQAGLSEDWEYTGGPIWQDRQITPEDETYVYLGSNWATPTIIIDEVSTPCWRRPVDDADFGAKEYWPESARAIVAAF